MSGSFNHLTLDLQISLIIFFKRVITNSQKEKCLFNLVSKVSRKKIILSFFELSERASMFFWLLTDIETILHLEHECIMQVETLSSEVIRPASGCDGTIRSGQVLKICVGILTPVKLLRRNFKRVISGNNYCDKQDYYVLTQAQQCFYASLQCPWLS